VRLDLGRIEKAEAAVIELLDQPNPPTALFTGQNLITIGAFRPLRLSELDHRIDIVLTRMTTRGSGEIAP